MPFGSLEKLYHVSIPSRIARTSRAMATTHTQTPARNIIRSLMPSLYHRFEHDAVPWNYGSHQFSPKPHNKACREAAHEWQYRHKHGLAAAEGTHLGFAIRQSGRMPTQLIVAESAQRNVEVASILDLASSTAVEVVLIKDSLFLASAMPVPMSVSFR